MNADRHIEPFISKWVLWGAGVMAFLLVFGSVMLVSSFMNGKPTSAAERGLKPTIAPEFGAGPQHVYVVDRPPKGETPNQIARQLPNLSNDSEAKVTVRPADQNAAKKNAGSVRKSSGNHSPVSDMFPVGKVVQRAPKPAATALSSAPRTAAPAAAAPPRKQVAKARSNPGFEYEGKVWRSTGTYAEPDQVELKSTGHQQDGKDVYSLSDSNDPDHQVLFVPSNSDPNRYEIYRATQG